MFLIKAKQSEKVESKIDNKKMCTVRLGAFTLQREGIGCGAFNFLLHKIFLPACVMDPGIASILQTTP